MEKQKQAPRGPIGPIYGQIEDLRANSPEDPTQCFCPGGVFGAVVSGPIPFITIYLWPSFNRDAMYYHPWYSNNMR